MSIADPLAPAAFTLTETPQGITVVLAGAWTARVAKAAGGALAARVRGLERLAFDLTQVERLDTAGAFALVRAAGDRFDPQALAARPETVRLLELVRRASMARPITRPSPHDLHTLVMSIGRGCLGLATAFAGTLAFTGHVMISLALSLANPRRIRGAAWTSQIERAGLDAIPIVGTTSFFIGAVVGLLGVHMLQRFGAQVYAVELIGVAVLREFGVVITAVLLAGRSASAFAAELGAMKMQQEVDALKVLGVDPIEALVLPRVAALLIAMPLLTFVAILTGLVGGLLVTWSSLGLAPAFFLERIVDNVGIAHLWVGISKTPIMAAVIAGIGCHQGLEVGGDVESLGRRVTAAVVHAIFAIIIIDAVFALIYMTLDI